MFGRLLIGESAVCLFSGRLVGTEGLREIRLTIETLQKWHLPNELLLTCHAAIHSCFKRLMCVCLFMQAITLMTHLFSRVALTALHWSLPGMHRTTGTCWSVVNTTLIIYYLIPEVETGEGGRCIQTANEKQAEFSGGLTRASRPSEKVQFLGIFI